MTQPGAESEQAAGITEQEDCVQEGGVIGGSGAAGILIPFPPSQVQNCWHRSEYTSLGSGSFYKGANISLPGIFGTASFSL